MSESYPGPVPRHVFFFSSPGVVKIKPNIVMHIADGDCYRTEFPLTRISVQFTYTNDCYTLYSAPSKSNYENLSHPFIKVMISRSSWCINSVQHDCGLYVRVWSSEMRAPNNVTIILVNFAFLLRHLIWFVQINSLVKNGCERAWLELFGLWSWHFHDFTMSHYNDINALYYYYSYYCHGCNAS